MVLQRGVISYPTPAYQNVPIHAEFYQPRRFVITAISLGVTTTVTTSLPHDYVIGQEVRLIIPPTFGSRGLNEKKGYVLSIPSSTQVIIDIFSIGIDPFKTSTATTQPQILAIGDINSGAINANGRVNLNLNIPGSFINISPL
jgi:hypothetical protein